jgi:hypothetical protein
MGEGVAPAGAIGEAADQRPGLVDDLCVVDAERNAAALDDLLEALAFFDL